MRSLNSIELLNVWEAGLNQTLIEKSLRLLGISCSASHLTDIASLSIGERDDKLLQLREWMFGTRLNNVATCPECLTRIEWESNLNELRLHAPAADMGLKEYSLETEGFTIHFRLLNSNDLLKAASSSAYHSNPKKLLSECILSVQYGQQDYHADSLPDTVFDALIRRIGEEDPQADIQMLIDCPVCSHRGELTFDIMSYLWIEIDNWARHILQEVYVLARAFSWSEIDILNLSTQRRQLYLEMLRS